MRTVGSSSRFAAAVAIAGLVFASGVAASHHEPPDPLSGAGAPPPDCETEVCACAGDCNGDRVVRINELIGLVRIALRLDPLEACPDADTNADGAIGVGEIVAAVQRSLDGCDGEAVFSGFDAADVVYLAGDDLDGRNNDTPGSAAAQQYIIDQIRDFAVGLNTAATGDDAYLQRFPLGANILAVIPGGELADEVVMLGAHYDHLGGCAGICNGATDNAAGVAAVLAVARGIAALPAPPRRSVVLAFWDREEDGLLGSRYYVENPLLPLASTVAYLNFDIQGANLLPSLRNFSFAVGAETGGDRLAAAVDAAVSRVDLQTLRVSAIFGQGRSDYVHFVNARVPTVFFGDSTGPCYHTAGDDVDVVDFAKLEMQSEIGFELTRALAATDELPSFTMAPPVVFADAQRLLEVFDAAVAADLDLFAPADAAVLLEFHGNLTEIVAAGPEAFDGEAIGTFLTGVVSAIELLGDLPCDGFLE